MAPLTSLAMGLWLLLAGTRGAPLTTDPQPPSLYNQSTDVGLTVLTHLNFNTTLFTADDKTDAVIWFIQFYNAWCGHCQHFAPTWKELANATLAWSRTLRLAVMDCSLRDHAAVCNHYNVQSFPTMHFLAPHTPLYTQGEAYVGPHTRAGTYHGILDYVEKRAFPAECVALPPGGLTEQWGGLAGAEHLALMVEEAGEDVGKDVVLSVLGQTKLLSVRRATIVNAALVQSLQTDAKEGAGKGLWFVSKSGPITKFEFTSKDPSVHDYMQAIYAKDDSLCEAQKTPKLARTPVPYARTPTPTTSAAHPDKKPSQPHPPAPLRPLNTTDLLSAVVYMFSMEVHSHTHIAGPDLAGLQLFTSLLDQLIPLPSPTYNAIQSLAKTLKTQDQTEAASVLSLLKDNGLDVDKAPLVWANCQGSQPGKRGYPCALWQLFHTLTVRYDEKNAEKTANALDESGVLRGIFGFVGQFFSCSECRDNFMREANALLGQTDTLAPKAAILWLWRVHNGVNKRLAGDVTEDENYPKRQFPPEELCPACRDPHGQWVEEEVLRFLRDFYQVKGDEPPTPLRLVRNPRHRAEVLAELEAAREQDRRVALAGAGTPSLLIGLVLLVAVVVVGVRQLNNWRRRSGRSSPFDFGIGRSRVKWM